MVTVGMKRCILKANSRLYRYLPFVLMSMTLLQQECMQSSRKEKPSNQPPVAGKEMVLSHAKGFSIEEMPGGKRVSVFNPWQGAENVVYRYWFTNDTTDDMEEMAREMRIHIPARRVICLSTTHVALVSFVNEENAIVGVSGASYLCNKIVRKKISEGKVPDVGYDLSLNYELILSLHPDVVLAYGVNSQVTGVYERLKSLHIPTLFIGEYLEPDPLAKAEWVKLVACLFGKEDMAALKYAGIEAAYISTRDKVAKTTSRPMVMTGLPWKETWNVAGGNSFTAKLIHDAGGVYLWSARETRDNIPLSVESVMNDSGQADIWINAGVAESLRDILATDDRLKDIRPFRLGQVYNNNAQMCPGGGNAYWESGVVNPDVVLRELVAIFHPELSESVPFTYYMKLK